MAFISFFTKNSFFLNKTKGDFRGRWPQAIRALILPILGILILRWAVVEPFVIPSGSMIPTLKIHDHLIVQKFSFGIKWPFGSDYIFNWSSPRRGDIVVFRYPKNPQIFYIKRVIGIPGDKIQFKGHQLILNDQSLTYKLQMSADENTDISSESQIYEEDILGAKHFVRILNTDSNEKSIEFQESFEVDQIRSQEFIVPKGSYFVLGDNRDESSDSRVWGFVEINEMIGKPWVILMGCSKSLQSTQFCHPRHFDWNRFFKVP